MIANSKYLTDSIDTGHINTMFVRLSIHIGGGAICRYRQSITTWNHTYGRDFLGDPKDEAMGENNAIL